MRRDRPSGGVIGPPILASVNDSDGGGELLGWMPGKRPAYFLKHFQLENQCRFD